ncbi:hypothetical protein ACFL5V_09255 [Fibrobacterota bacterium]
MELKDREVVRMEGNQIESFIKGLKQKDLGKEPQVNYSIRSLPVKSDPDITASNLLKTGRPRRTNPFSKDELLNLKIALESSRDVSDFVRML